MKYFRHLIDLTFMLGIVICCDIGWASHLNVGGLIDGIHVAKAISVGDQIITIGSVHLGSACNQKGLTGQTGEIELIFGGKLCHCLIYRTHCVINWSIQSVIVQVVQLVRVIRH